MKIKIMPLILVGMISVTVVSVVTAVTKVNNTSALDTSLNIAKEVSKLYKGGDLDNLLGDINISNEVKVKLKDFEEGLKSKDNLELDLTSMFEDEYIDDVYDNVLDEPDSSTLDYLPEGELPSESVSTIPNSSLIYTKEGKDYIKVKDIVFKNDIAYIDYGGGTKTLRRSEVPYTYEAMLNDVNFNFKIVNYEECKEGRKRYTDILYKSSKGDVKLLIRVYNKGKEIVDIEITEG